uniref:(northern house mosquito) hypothetical protein n=1 Tax=Culex pipiens TaxID=7175 RepID=A0A8D8IUW8_CULPI
MAASPDRLRIAIQRALNKRCPMVDVSVKPVSPERTVIGARQNIFTCTKRDASSASAWEFREVVLAQACIGTQYRQHSTMGSPDSRLFPITQIRRLLLPTCQPLAAKLFTETLEQVTIPSIGDSLLNF